MLHFDNLVLRRGARVLFSGANVKIHPGQKVGVTGVNGSGKSSLFSLILEELQPDAGECHVPADWTIAHVEQEAASTERSAIDYVLDGDKRLRSVESELVIAQQQDDGVKVSELHSRMDEIGGYAARSRGAQLLDGLGFVPSQIEQPVSTFSGGWRMRLNLGRALMCQSDLLLLDEPTNHLDLDAIVWLEQWLRSYSGALMMVSHDRDFLDRTVDHILHIEMEKIRLFRGNYAAFEKRRIEQLSHERSRFLRQQREVQHIQSFIDRFRYKATKARQAQSRLKALERMTLIVPAHVDSEFRFSMRPPEKLPATLVKLDNCSAGYDGSTVVSNVKLRLVPGDRVGLLGSNGAGKSTLIKLLAGELKPLMGERHTDRDVNIGYFAQRQLDQLSPELSSIQHMRQIEPAAGEQILRDYLGEFGFSNGQALAPVAQFSGGEKSRLVLAMIVYRKPNLLLLDEPTNHLDIEMRQALAYALQDFSGAMVLVSHDRHLLRVSCDDLLLVDRGRVERYEQSLDDYANWLGRRKQLLKGSDNSGRTGKMESCADRRLTRRRGAELRKRLQPLTHSIRKAEADIGRLTDEKRKIESELTDNTLYVEDQKPRLKELLLRKAAIDRSLDEAEAEWLTASEKAEKLSDT